MRYPTRGCQTGGRRSRLAQRPEGCPESDIEKNSARSLSSRAGFLLPLDRLNYISVSVSLDLVHELKDVLALNGDLDAETIANQSESFLHGIEIKGFGVEGHEHRHRKDVAQDRLADVIDVSRCTHSASAVATAATIPLRSLPRTEITHFMKALPSSIRPIHGSFTSQNSSSLQGDVFRT